MGNEDNRLNLGFPVPKAALFGVAAVVLLALVFALTGGDDTPKPASETDVSETNEQQTPKDEKAADTLPAFDLVRISRGGTGVIAGRMSPGAVVELYANGQLLSKETADENGEWVIILDQPLEAGSVELNLKARDTLGEVVAEASDVVVVSVPERDSERFMEERENGVVAVLSPKDGSGASRVMQKPGVAAFSEVGESLAVETVDYGDGGLPVLSGRSLPRVDVRLYMDGSFQGSVRADDNGRWVIEMKNIIETGQHMIRVDQTVGEGQVQLRIEQPFETGKAIDPTKAASGVMVRPGNTLWEIARQLYGSGVRYTLIFRENSEQIVDPDLIYPGQMFRLPQNENTQ